MAASISAPHISLIHGPPGTGPFATTTPLVHVLKIVNCRENDNCSRADSTGWSNVYVSVDHLSDPNVANGDCNRLLSEAKLFSYVLLQMLPSIIFLSDWLVVEHHCPELLRLGSYA